jgi:hypothetical protein
MTDHEIAVPTEEEIGRRVAAAMQLAEIDQKEVARLVKESGARMSESTLSRLLRRGVGLTVPRLVLIAGILAGRGYLAKDVKRLLLYLQGAVDDLPIKKKTSA